MSVTNEQVDVSQVPRGSSPDGQNERPEDVLAPTPNALDGLQFIAEFLNAVSPTTTRATWRAYLRRFIEAREAQGYRYTFGPLADRPDEQVRRYKARATLRQAKHVRQLIASDLRYLHFDRDHLRTTEPPFAPLMIRLNEQFREGHWELKTLGPERPEPGQAVLRLRKSDGSIERYTASFKPPLRIARTLQEWVYAVLSPALLSGDLVRLKLCRQCAQYFVARKDLKRDFCSKRCNARHFHSTLRVQDWRKTTRARMQERAVALHKQGESYEWIKEKTELPNRVLKKLGVLP